MTAATTMKAQIQEEAPPKKKGVAAGIIVLVAKLGLKALSVLVKFGKAGKFALAGAAMASYAYLFTWQFAVLVMLMLALHEYGHVWAMRRCGMKVRGMYFIPFMGAVAIADDIWPDRMSEAYIAAMGPTWGLAPAFGCFAVWTTTGHPLFAVGAAWMSAVNLFNMLPVNPLDGGRIMKAGCFSLGRWPGLIAMILGILALAAGCFVLGVTLFAILLPIAILEFAIEWHFRREAATELPRVKAGLDDWIARRERLRNRVKRLDRILANRDGRHFVRGMGLELYRMHKESGDRKSARAAIEATMTAIEETPPGLVPEEHMQRVRCLRDGEIAHLDVLGNMVNMMDKRLKHLDALVSSAKPMTRREGLVTAAWVGALIWAFVAILLATAHIPAAGAGLEIFK